MTAPTAVLRVCHIIHHLAPGGAERLLVQLAEVAQVEHLHVSVLSIMDSGPFAFAQELRSRGVVVEDLGATSRWDPRSLALGVSAVRRLRPHLLHTHLKHADILGAVASARLGIPMVSTMHNIEASVGPILRFKRYAGAWARLHQAQRTITVSDAQRAWYLDAFHVNPAHVVTIRNGVTLPAPAASARSAIRGQFGFEDDHVVALMLGVMRPGKGHDQLLDAVEQLPPSSPLRFVLAGDGPRRAELEQRATTLADEVGRIVFAGWRSDVADLLAASDMVVHPTLFDALPTALIEALGAGLPSVASNVGGVPEIVTAGCGILVAPDRPRELAAALIELAADPNLRRRLGVQARRRYDEEFSAHRWAGRLRNLYDEVLAG